MKNPFIFSILFIFSGIQLSAQQFSLSGFVRNESNGEPIADVWVTNTSTGATTQTNSSGFYNFIIPSGQHIIRYYKKGLEPKMDTVYLGSDLLHSVELYEDIYYTVPPKQELHSGDFPDEPAETPYLSYDPDDLFYIPPVYGQEDLVKTLQLMPGVQGGIEASAGLNVRGGSPDQNLYLLDGIPIYNINHAFGFFSTFQPDAIDDFKLRKGGFSARYGSRLSSVLDIRLKEGSAKEVKGSAGIGFMGFYAHAEAPIINEKTTFNFSMRHSVPGIITLLNPLARGGANEQAGARYNDLTAKVTHKINETDKISFLYFRAKNVYFSTVKTEYSTSTSRFREVDEQRLEWGNNVGAVQYQKRINPRLMSNYSLSYSGYMLDLLLGLERTVRGDSGTSEDKISYKLFSGIRDGNLKADYEWAYSAKHQVRFGGIYTLHGFAPGALEAQFSGNNRSLDTLFGNASTLFGNQFALYIEDDIRFSKRLRVNAGLRLSGFNAMGKFFVNPEPRLAVRYGINEHLAFKSSYSRMVQYLHRLNTTGLGLPADLWVPATDKLRPESAHQFTAAVVRTISDHWEFSIEGFYKRFNNVVDFAEGQSVVDLEFNWENRLESGKGEAYGVELMLQKTMGDLTGWFSYTWSKSQRQFDNINNGQWYDYRFDRRHQTSLSLVYRIQERRALTFNAVYGTGYPVTFPYGRYLDANGREVFDYEGKNALRLRDYMRIDIGYASIRQSYNSSFKREFFVSVYNLTNRSNPVLLELTTGGNGRPSVEEVSIFPFFPSMTYRITF